MILGYDIKSNIGSAKKVVGKTEMCLNCGTLEALEDFMIYK